MSDTVVIPRSDKPEDSFGKYQILSELGEGAMGKVFKCFDPDFHRMVAIKTVHKSLLDDSSSNEFRERFRNEMRAAGKLTHPNIVSVFDAGEKDGCPYFVMEYVEGDELKHMLDSGQSFSVDESLAIIKGVLRGLSSIHSNGITHRDLKPANIFVSTSGVAKIADFGIAKLDNSEMTQIGTIIGSPKYMAPEQCIGQPVDARSDIFAVGIVLYEMLTGEYCFQGESTTDITQKILNVEPNLASVVNPQIPRYLDKVLKKALSKRADDRYQNALDFLNALDTPEVATGSFSKTLKWTAGGVAATGLIAVLTWFVLSQQLGSTTGEEELVWTTQGGPQSQHSGEENDGGQPVENAPESEQIGGSYPLNNSDNVDKNSLQSASEFTESPSAKIAKSTPNVEALSPEKSAKLEKLFKVAETYKRIGRLVSPSGSNAFDAYQIALSIDPNNSKALEGIQSVKKDLLDRVNKALDSGDNEMAKANIQAGTEVFPNEPEFPRLLARIQ